MYIVIISCLRVVQVVSQLAVYNIVFEVTVHDIGGILPHVGGHTIVITIIDWGYG